MTENGNSTDHIKDAWELVKATDGNNTDSTIAEKWQKKQAAALDELDPKIAQIIEDAEPNWEQYEATLPPWVVESSRKSFESFKLGMIETDARLKELESQPKMQHHSGCDIGVS